MHTVLGKPTCALCQESTDKTAICEDCLADVNTLWFDEETVCKGCLRHTSDGLLCGHCQQHSPITCAQFASFQYDYPVKQLLHAFKHLRQIHLSRALCTLMLQNPPIWLPETPIDAVLAMPLSRERLLERGFNQSRFLAQSIADVYALPLLDDTAVLRQHRVPQSTLNGKARLNNVRGIFQAAADVKKSHLLLIDDVITTGATVNELSKTLIKAGVKGIWVWALAHPK
ncbi:ComF family protein [Stenoxybacter acetivorans]|uniref:ComF family protein n=1 Tax=Stenoxybacter acetivorans TaxID=422441 RepID=UPI0005613373|nr:ComF family protein [Stenoxybacter acetivorans]